MSRRTVIKSIESGIYRREVHEVEHEDVDAVDPRAYVANLQEQEAGFLDAVRECARDVLKKHGVELDADRFPIFRDANGGASRAPKPLDELPEIVRDAARLLVDLLAVESNLLAARIFNAGRLFERMLVRQFEPAALQGRKAASGHAKKAAAKKATSDRENASRKRVWLQIRRENPGAKVTEIDRQAAEQLDVDERTIADARRAGKWKQEI